LCVSRCLAQRRHTGAWGCFPPQLPQLLFTALFAEKKKAGFILSRQMLKSKFKREPDAKIVSETDLLSGI
jgi:hypothetical protein